MSDVSDLDDAALDAIEARTNAATMGPWDHYSTVHADAKVVGSTGHWPADEIAAVSSAPEDYGHADAEFIAHARTDVPALVAALRAEREEVARLRRIYDSTLTEGMRFRGERDAAIARIAELDARLTETIRYHDERVNRADRNTDAAIARADAAEADIAAVRALHATTGRWPKDSDPDEVCQFCWVPVPCATIRALDTGATT